MQTAMTASGPDSIENAITFVLSVTRPEVESISKRSRINEEHLYVAALDERIGSLKPNLRKRFEDLFAKEFAGIRAKQKRTLVLASADRVMRAFVRSGEITREIYRATLAFALGKAQLDSDRTWIGTLRASDARAGDTPVRAISTAVLKYAENASASDAEVYTYRRRIAERSQALRRQS